MSAIQKKEQFAIAESWQELTNEITTKWGLLLQDSQRAIRGSLAVGALIVMFSERPEIQAEAERAKQKQRGPKFSTIGYVAAKIVEDLGAQNPTIPSVRQLRDCASAAIEARKRGIVKGSISELLALSRNYGSHCLNSESITLPKFSPVEKNAKKVIKLEPYSRTLQKGFAAIRRTLQELVKRQSRGAAILNDEERDDLNNAVEDINDYLIHFNLKIVDSKRTR